MVETGTWEHGGVRFGLRGWDGDGSPVVLVHGFAQSAASWDEVAAALAACGRTACAIDLVGHGASDRPVAPAAYALEAQAEALLAFLASFETPPAVIGYSLGGRVALAAAARDPHAFAACADALILEGAGLGPADADERAQAAARDAANAARLRKAGVQAFMDDWERLPLFATQLDLPAATREHVRSGRLANDVESLARMFEHAGQHAMPAHDEVLAALATLRDQGLPVLYLAGARDAKYRALAEELAADGLCETRLVDGVGHNAHLEDPAAFVREAKAFLSVR